MRDLIAEANTARGNRRALESIETYEYADNAMFLDAKARIDASIAYLESRSHLIDAKREAHRQLILSSGLPPQGRADLWQPLMRFYDEAASELRRDEGTVARYETLGQLAEFMNRSRRRYEVNQSGDVMSRNVDLLLRHRQLVFELETGAAAQYAPPTSSN